MLRLRPSETSDTSWRALAAPISALLLAGCGGATTPTSTTVATAPSTVELALAPIRLAGPTGEITLDAEGVVAENGEPFGTFTRDGGFVNNDGVEIGRLTPAGLLYFAGRRETARLDEANALREGADLVASFDERGDLVVQTNDGPVTLPMQGVTPETARTAMFLFAMYSGLFHLAREMPAEAEGDEAPAPTQQDATPTEAAPAP